MVFRNSKNIGQPSPPGPPGLLAEVRAAAEEEHRAPGDLVREAIERYLREKRWQKVFAYGEQRAKELGLTEADIPRMIAEVRRIRISTFPGLSLEVSPDSFSAPHLSLCRSRSDGKADMGLSSIFIGTPWYTL
jgi:hypothetical protein